MEVSGTPAAGATLTVRSGTARYGTFCLKSYVDGASLAGLDVDVLDFVEQLVLIAMVLPQWEPPAPAMSEVPFTATPLYRLPDLADLRDKLEALYEKQAVIRVHVDMLTTTCFRLGYNNDAAGNVILNNPNFNPQSAVEMKKVFDLADWVLRNRQTYQRVIFIMGGGLAYVKGQAGNYGSKFAVVEKGADANTYCHEFGHMLKLYHPWNDVKPIPVNSQEFVPGPLSGRIMGYSGSFNLIKI